MSLRSVRMTGLAFLLALAACETGPTDPAPEPELSPELAMEQLAAEANRAGDPDNAAAFSGGALAIRLGASPSEIAVKVGNEWVTYHAVMVGIVRKSRSGEQVLVRSLLAWTGNRRPTAILQVSSRSDQALFGHAPGGGGLADTPGLAIGVWADLVNQRRWIAAAGSADMTLAGTGGPCPILATRAVIQCMLATYDIRINGNFVPAVDPGPGEHLQIHTNEDGVNGVVISPVD